MTRGLLCIDRLVTLLVGLGLVVLGLVVIDWHYGEVLTYGDALDTTPVADLMDTTWWSWVFGAAGLVLGLLGLLWLLAHLRRHGPSTLRLRSSGPSGRVETDLRSVATASAERLGTLAPVTGVRGTTRVYGSHTVVELRGHVDTAADAASLTEAAEACAADIAVAFPDDEVTCRVVLDAPQRSRTGRRTRPPVARPTASPVRTTTTSPPM